MNFKLKSKFKPAGDQPKAIKTICEGLRRKDRMQTLLGVTGSGKTFTVANVIAETNRPALVIAHNKTLAAQLCQEFRGFFPENAVHYFVSYYDYYQPEAYLPTTDTYIDKEAMINDEIDRLRHAATQVLLTRRDVIIVASVSCIYGLGEPETYEAVNLHLKKGSSFDRGEILKRLVEMQFVRQNGDLKRGTFRLRGEILDIMPVSEERIYRFELDSRKITDIIAIDPVTRKIKSKENDAWIFPAKHFITLGPERERALRDIKKELDERLKYFEENGKFLEAERLARRTKYDLEMMREMGYCHGIENYSRHLSGRKAGETPATLLDYFPDDFLTVIDESHVTAPQIGGMYEGDASRKKTLIEFGFRLPSAADNRPLKFGEFEKKIGQIIFTSATPGDYERQHSSQVVEQIIRPTGLVDPKLTVLPITETAKNKSQIDDLIPRLKERAKAGERALVTTLTKKMAEDLTDYLKDEKIKVNYVHSDIKALERIKILTDFRRGKFDCLVGVNLLREGLDLPEVTLVAILDADKEGFLRSETSLIQTIGRAARNVLGEVILYADNITGSMRRAIGETERRRKLQLEYNAKHGITPQTIKKIISDILPEIGGSSVLALDMAPEKGKRRADIIKEKEREMKEAAANLQFELAAVLRDEIKILRKK
jgi:excinuclease ABC subunit B